MPAARFLICGKVQGVWFRASTLKQAEQLGLGACHATNLVNGGVEVLAVGDVASLDALQAWLHEGPPLAHVDHVAREDVEADGVPVGFNIA